MESPQRKFNVARLSRADALVKRQHYFMTSPQRKYTKSEILFPVPISRESYDSLIKEYPEAEYNQTALNLLYSLVVESYLTPKKIKEVFKTSEEIWLYAGIERMKKVSGAIDLKDSAKVSQALAEFSEIFPDVIEKSRPHQHSRKQATKILLNDKSRAIEILLSDLKVSLAKKTNPVFIVSGEKYYTKDRRGITRLRHELIESLKTQARGKKEKNRLNKAREIIKYFDALDPAEYAIGVKRIELVINHINKEMNNSKRKKERAYLKNLLVYMNNLRENMSVPKYEQNCEFNARVTIKGASLQNLPGQYRKIILKDSVSVDISACHIKIVAKELDFKPFIDFYERHPDKDIYKYIATSAGLREVTPNLRRLVKRMTISIIYGAGKERLYSFAKGAVEFQYAKKLIETPGSILRKLHSSVSKYAVTVAREGGITFVDGKFHKVTRKNSALKLIAIRTQQIEAFIISECYVYAAKNLDKFVILSHEHDGFTFIPRNSKDKDRIVDDLNGVIVAASREYGYKMNLVEKE